LRSSQVRAPFRGVRVPAHVPDDVATTAAAAAWLVPDLVLEGVSACGYYDLPLPLAVDPLHPLVAGTSAIRCRVRGIRPRHVTGSGNWPLGEFRVVSPVAAWATALSDPRLHEIDALVIADALMSLSDGPASPADLRTALARHAGAETALAGERVVQRASPRVGSPQESRLRHHLIEDPFPPGLVNVAQYGWDGAFLATPDVCWREVKVALEYDGEVHLERRQWRKDLRRREALEADGWRVIVVIAADLHDVPALNRRVAEALLARGMRWPGCERWLTAG